MDIIKPLTQDHLLFPEILWQMPQNIYKRQRGKILVIAGSKGMTGAAVLVCEAAYRTGCGIVVLGFPETILSIYKKLLPESLTMPLPATRSGSLSIKALDDIIQKSLDFDVVALGPGLSLNPETLELIWQVIFKIQKPLVVDADALSALALGLELIKNKEGVRKAQEYLEKRKETTIITPHPGEASKLIKALQIKIAGRLKNINSNFIDQNKKEAAWSIAHTTNFITILKGRDTTIAEPGGKIVINKTGGPSLATAGTGDVLVGIMATLLSQNLTKAFPAACTAVYIHGLSGDIAASKIGSRSLIASDVIKYLPEAIRKAEKEIK